MDKILLVIKREYLSRVKKKSFIILTLLGPILFLAVSILPTYFLMANTDTKTIAIIDDSGLFSNDLSSSESVQYVFITKGLKEAKEELGKGKEYDGLVYIPKMTIENPQGVFIYFEENVGVNVESTLSSDLERIVKKKRLTKAGLTQSQLDNLEVDIPVKSTEIQEAGKTEVEKSTSAATAVGYACGIMIYMFIFIYGAAVMKGVVEEKTSRIMEVMLSSVKPMQLMMGKIIGISFVGLTQLLLWIILTIGISSGATIFLASQMESSKTEMVLKEAAKQRTSALQVPNTQNTIQEQNQPEQADVLTEVKQALGTINMPLVVACFLFYFLGGYFLYGSMFAAVGAAGDSETDAQQFTLPISIPLIISFMAASAIIKDPGSTLATVLSIFPLTSPIIMMVRIPFGVPAWEIVASMVSLIIGFVTFTWLASRIYRVGILMYGKKITYKELSKWIFYKF